MNDYEIKSAMFYAGVLLLTVAAAIAHKLWVVMQ